MNRWTHPTLTRRVPRWPFNVYDDENPAGIDTTLWDSPNGGEMLRLFKSQNDRHHLDGFRASADNNQDRTLCTGHSSSLSTPIMDFSQKTPA